MLLSSQKVISAFHKIKLIKEHRDLYCIIPDRIPVSVEDIKYVVGDMYDLSIEMLSVSFDGDFLRGMVERYSDRKARVLVRSDQPDNWKRYIAVKEIAHLAIDEEDDWSPSGVETIDGLIYESRPEVDGDHEAEAEIQSELLAEWIAMELLYPYEFRETDLERVEKDELTFRSLALHYGIPEFVVGQALHPSSMELTGKIWADIQSQETP